MCKSLCCSNVWLFCQQASTDTPAPVETPQEEVREPVPDSDSEQYPEDDIPEDEEEEDEEDEDDDTEDSDYKVSPPTFSIKLNTGWLQVHFSESSSSVFDMQAPPTVATPEKKDDDDEGTMPPYDQETQNLIDGKWMTQAVLIFEWVSHAVKYQEQNRGVILNVNLPS